MLDVFESLCALREALFSNQIGLFAEYNKALCEKIPAVLVPLDSGCIRDSCYTVWGSWWNR